VGDQPLPEELQPPALPEILSEETIAPDSEKIIPSLPMEKPPHPRPGGSLKKRGKAGEGWKKEDSLLGPEILFKVLKRPPSADFDRVGFQAVLLDQGPPIRGLVDRVSALQLIRRIRLREAEREDRKSAGSSLLLRGGDGDDGGGVQAAA
jgi:hypothetical protein